MVRGHSLYFTKVVACATKWSAYCFATILRLLANLYNGHLYIWNTNDQSLVKSFEVTELPGEWLPHRCNGQLCQLDNDDYRLCEASNLLTLHHTVHVHTHASFSAKRHSVKHLTSPAVCAKHTTPTSPHC